MKKRYALVMVNNVCPARIDNLSCNETKGMLRCKCGKDIKNYGDTKEELIRKVTQVIKRETTKNDGLIFPDEEGKEKLLIWKKIAKKTVEFLGVSE